VIHRRWLEHSLPFISEGIQALNEIRNKLAHRLTAEITARDTEMMMTFLTMFPNIRQHRAYLESHVAVMAEVFAVWSCSIIALVEEGQNQMRNLDDQLGAEGQGTRALARHERCISYPSLCNIDAQWCVGRERPR
jgi:hypothetical protein